MNKISLLMPRGLGDAFFSPKDASSKQRTKEEKRTSRGKKKKEEEKEAPFQGGSRKMVVNKFRGKARTVLVLEAASGHHSIEYESIRWGEPTLVTFQSN